MKTMETAEQLVTAELLDGMKLSELRDLAFRLYEAGQPFDDIVNRIHQRTLANFKLEEL
jgi:hypothetical protein